MRTHPPMLQERRRRRVDRELLLVAVAAAVAVAAGWTVTRPAEKVERLTVDNPTPWELTVQVGPRPPDAWTTLGVVPAQGSWTVEDVLDQGDSWVVRFAVAGRESEPVRVSRADLRRDGWRVAVPRQVAQSFRSLEVPPTPR